MTQLLVVQERQPEYTNQCCIVVVVAVAAAAAATTTTRGKGRWCCMAYRRSDGAIATALLTLHEVMPMRERLVLLEGYQVSDGIAAIVHAMSQRKQHRDDRKQEHEPQRQLELDLEQVIDRHEQQLPVARHQQEGRHHVDHVRPLEQRVEWQRRTWQRRHAMYNHQRQQQHQHTHTYSVARKVPAISATLQHSITHPPHSLSRQDTPLLSHHNNNNMMSHPHDTVLSIQYVDSVFVRFPPCPLPPPSRHAHAHARERENYKER